MSTNIKNLMDWWKQFNKTDIKVTTESHNLQIDIKTAALPHLLGLQYTLKDTKSMKGLDLFYECYTKDDNEIFRLIESNNPNRLQSVQERCKTFQLFMENLNEGIFVENTKQGSKIKSQHFILEIHDNKILHLGLLTIPGEDALVNYEVVNKKLETYFSRKDATYFVDTLCCEKIQSIEKYNEEGILVPFSFSNDDKTSDKNCSLDFKEESSKIVETYSMLDPVFTQLRRMADTDNLELIDDLEEEGYIFE